METLQYHKGGAIIMANWAKEIMKLANDLCLNMSKAREIVDTVNALSVPQGKRRI